MGRWLDEAVMRLGKRVAELEGELREAKQDLREAEKMSAEHKGKRGRKPTRLQSIIGGLTELGAATVPAICKHIEAMDKVASVAQTIRNNKKLFAKAGMDGRRAKWKLAE